MLSIEFRNNHILLVEGSVSGKKVTVKKSAMVSYDPNWSNSQGVINIDEVSDLLVSFLDSEKFGSRKDAVVCFNQSHSIYRELKVPVVPDKKLELVVRTEMISALNLTNDFTIDFIIINEESDETGKFYNVLAFAAHNDFLESYLEIFKRAKLKVKIADFSTNAIIKLLNETDYLHVNKMSIVLTVSAKHLRMYLFNGFEYAFTRNVMLGNTENVTSEVTENLNKMVQFIHTKYQFGDNSQVILTGEEEFFSDVKSDIENDLRIDCDVFDFPTNIVNQTGLSLLPYICTVGAMIRRR